MTPDPDAVLLALLIHLATYNLATTIFATGISHTANVTAEHLAAEYNSVKVLLWTENERTTPRLIGTVHPSTLAHSQPNARAQARTFTTLDRAHVFVGFSAAVSHAGS
jgi:NAD-dependent DNA ligase